MTQQSGRGTESSPPSDFFSSQDVVALVVVAVHRKENPGVFVHFHVADDVSLEEVGLLNFALDKVKAHTVSLWDEFEAEYEIYWGDEDELGGEVQTKDT